MTPEEHGKISVLSERIGNLIERLDKFEEIAERRFVTRVEFAPVQKIVYSGVGIILCTVLVALIALVIHKTPNL